MSISIIMLHMAMSATIYNTTTFLYQSSCNLLQCMPLSMTQWHFYINHHVIYGNVCHYPCHNDYVNVNHHVIYVNVCHSSCNLCQCLPLSLTQWLCQCQSPYNLWQCLPLSMTQWLWPWCVCHGTVSDWRVMGLITYLAEHHQHQTFSISGGTGVSWKTRNNAFVSFFSTILSAALFLLS